MNRILAFVLSMLSLSLSAQLTVKGTPLSFDLDLEAGTCDEPIVLPVSQYVNEDEAQSEGLNPLLVGVSIPFHKDVDQCGEWHQTAEGDLIWRLTVEAPEAAALSVVFTKFRLPDNAFLYLYDEMGTEVVGAISSLNNNENDIMSTSFVKGDRMTIELNIIQPQSYDLLLEIGEIVYHYPTIYGGDLPGAHLRSVPAAGKCFVGVNCMPEGERWRKQKRGIVLMKFRENGKWYYCSGSLLNNTNQDGAPLFLTAHHCGAETSAIDKSLASFTFNYEYVDCEATTHAESQSLVGCEMLSSASIDGGTDFMLVRLNSSPTKEMRPYYNGWDRSEIMPSSGVAIHHPSGDEKTISTFTSKLTYVTAMIDGYTGMKGSFFKVRWSQTVNGHSVTAGGSSGGALFNAAGYVVGSLSGGGSSCVSTYSSDYFGCFDRHWEANGGQTSAKSRILSVWLDPLDLGVKRLSGYDPYPVALDDSTAEQNIRCWSISNGLMIHCQKDSAPGALYSMDGRLLKTFILEQGDNFVPLVEHQAYVIHVGVESRTVIF